MSEIDTHVFAELSKRRRAIVGLPWRLAPPDNASQHEIDKTNELEQAFRHIINLHDVLFHATDAIGFGFSAQEITYHKDRFPARLDYRPASWFTLDKSTSRELQLRTTDGQAEALWPYKWLVHRQAALSGLLPNQPLFRTIAWTSIFKCFTLNELLTFLDEYGLPIRIGKYPSGTPDHKQQAMLTAMKSIGKQGVVLFDSAMELEFANATNTAGNATKGFTDMIAWLERKQSLAILGGTLTSEAGDKGARALGTIHNDVRLDILEQDAKQLAESLTQQLIVSTCTLTGLLPANRLPSWHFEFPDTLNRGTELTWMLQAQQAGVALDSDWVYKHLGLPKPSNNSANTLMPASQTATTRAIAALSSRQDNANEPLDLLVNQALQNTQHQVDSTLDAVYTIAATASDYQDALDALPHAVSQQLTGASYTDNIAKAFAVAHLAGMAETQQSNDNN